MKYFDSHAHYFDERFDEEYEGGAEKLLPSLFSGSVSHIINVGTSLETSRKAILQASKHDGMYTALGIHPSDSRFSGELDAEMSALAELIRDPFSKCVAIGETGFDYHYPDTDKEKQSRFFHAEMCLARDLGLPVVIHDRESHEDVMNVIRQYPTVRGILHSFSGSVEMAKELLKLGYYISLSGTLTFKNARRPKEVAAILPLDRVLIETAAPYLAPHPKRGTLNHSGNLSFTNAVLAEIKGIGEEECAAITSDNAKAIFGIKS